MSAPLPWSVRLIRSRSPADEHRVLRCEPHAEVGDRDAAGHADLHEVAEPVPGLHRPFDDRVGGDDGAARAQPAEHGIEHLDAAAADEDPIGIGEVGEHGRGRPLDDVDGDAVGRALVAGPLDLVGVAVDRR